MKEYRVSGDFNYTQRAKNPEVVREALLHILKQEGCTERDFVFRIERVTKYGQEAPDITPAELAGTKRGVADFKAGRIERWDKVKRELDLEETPKETKKQKKTRRVKRVTKKETRKLTKAKKVKTIKRRRTKRDKK